MKNLILFFAVFTACVLSSVNSKAQNNKPAVIPKPTSIEVIQFHSEHRCRTCLKIEQLTKKTLTNYFTNIPFKLVNVDEAKNAAMAEKFEASGTALFLFDPKTGRKKDLTDFAFMKAGNEKVFENELKKYIENFQKGL
ncbi:MAG: nitrophenyl compound nitroreductase subunit ArsF family protein [Bacteroidota bacterium]|nr:nitrophenyl compound nitroreductase subunit ArsF family protein [Bacteroidota bacterium]